ncbi:MAG: LLM class flavin-dependent oxidoreductase, partial [Actinomycetota bacterium]
IKAVLAAEEMDPDDHVRSARLDEALEILVGLWSGEPFSFAGSYHRIDDVRFLPAPAQEPRIPIWVAATWPNRAPLQRAARFEGVFPISAEFESGGTLSPEDVRELRAYVEDRRVHSGPFDIVVGQAPDPATLPEFADAGVTWWMESGFSPDEVRATIEAGPRKDATR